WVIRGEGSASGVNRCGRSRRDIGLPRYESLKIGEADGASSDDSCDVGIGDRRLLISRISAGRRREDIFPNRYTLVLDRIASAHRGLSCSKPWNLPGKTHCRTEIHVIARKNSLIRIGRVRSDEFESCEHFRVARGDRQQRILLHTGLTVQWYCASRQLIAV